MLQGQISSCQLNMQRQRSKRRDRDGSGGEAEGDGEPRGEKRVVGGGGKVAVCEAMLKKLFAKQLASLLALIVTCKALLDIIDALAPRNRKSNLRRGN